MPTYSQIMAGRRLLKRLLPEALRAAQSDVYSAKATSDVAKSLRTHLKLENLDAVVISEGRLGGWHTDVAFRNLPPGFPTAIGSPTEEPFISRQAALEGAPKLLVFVLQIIEQGKTLEKTAPVFEFHDLVIRLEPALLQALVERGIRDNITYAEVIEKLRALDDICANLDSEEAFLALPDAVKSVLLARCHMAAAAVGLFRYPPIEPKEPSPETSGGRYRVDSVDGVMNDPSPKEEDTDAV